MKQNKQYPCVVSIAGTDPSGGAGVQADIKAISATGGYAASVITAVIAQNTQGVQAIQEVSSELVHQQIESVFNDLTVQAVKIGMLSNEEIISVVAKALKKYSPTWVVLDPVMVAKSGCPLISESAVRFIKENLFPFTSVITPNLFEAEKLLGKKITNEHEQASAAITLGKEFGTNVLVKGGHFDLPQSSDVVYLYEEDTSHWFHADRIYTQHTHGTGCSLSSAIASYLAQGSPLRDAIHQAKLYLTKAIHSGSQFQLGKGHGPVDHFYFLKSKS